MSKNIIEGFFYLNYILAIDYISEPMDEVMQLNIFKCHPQASQCSANHIICI